MIARVVCAIALLLPAAALGGGQLKITVIDKESGQPVPCRMHLRNGAGKPRFHKGTPSFNDHFVLNGTATLKLPRGTYTFEIERGPEYVDVSGHFIIEDQANDEKTVTLKRAVNMAAEGWWSADMKVRRPVRDLKLSMAADDLHVAAVSLGHTKEGAESTKIELPAAVEISDDGSFYLYGYSDQRAGNDLLFFSLDKAASTIDLGGDKASVASLLAVNSREQVWLDVTRPFAADLPLGLALGRIDSIELANDHLCRSLVINSEAEGRRRDVNTLSGPLGNALWSQQIYYHVLNCGFRIPPTAGSGSGVSPNPVGYNRMYIYTGDKLDYDAWWKALKSGQLTVTNGPLIRPNVRGQLPGYVFQAAAGEALSLDISLSLSTRDKLSYLEVIKNGTVERAVRVEEWAKSGSLAPVVFKESGWFLIRAVTDVEDTYRFGSTAPYYVEIGEDAKHISKTSVDFFLDWAHDRAAELKKSPDHSAPDRVLYEQTIQFWEKLAADVNAP